MSVCLRGVSFAVSTLDSLASRLLVNLKVRRTRLDILESVPSQAHPSRLGTGVAIGAGDMAATYRIGSLVVIVCPKAKSSFGTLVR